MKLLLVTAAVLLGALASPTQAQVSDNLDQAEFLAYAADSLPTAHVSFTTSQTYFDNFTGSSFAVSSSTRAGLPFQNRNLPAVVVASATPEPASSTLVATGFLGIVAFARRRRVNRRRNDPA